MRPSRIPLLAYLVALVAAAAAQDSNGGYNGGNSLGRVLDSPRCCCVDVRNAVTSLARPCAGNDASWQRVNGCTYIFIHFTLPNP